MLNTDQQPRVPPLAASIVLLRREREVPKSERAEGADKGRTG